MGYGVGGRGREGEGVVRRVVFGGAGGGSGPEGVKGGRGAGVKGGRGAVGRRGGWPVTYLKPLSACSTIYVS